MSVECYALVSFYPVPTVEEKIAERKARRLEAKTTGLRVSELEYSKVEEVPIIKLCRIRLVQGKGKKGSVPKPRWEVVEEIMGYGDNEWEYDWMFNSKYHPPLLEKRGTLTTNFNVVLRNKTIQLRHIRSLFPECATMPFPIPLDYVRDKL